MERELISSKEFYVLYYDIFKMLSIEREHRMISGKIYLDDIHVKYCNLVENANLLLKYGNYEIVKKSNSIIDKEKENYNHYQVYDKQKMEKLEIENFYKEKSKNNYPNSIKNYISIHEINDLENTNIEDLNYNQEKMNVVIKKEQVDFDEEKQ